MEDRSNSKPKTPRNKLITAIQAVLIFLMSLAATASLLPDAGDKYYILAVVFGWLTVTGAVSLVFPKVSPIFFSISVFAASLWAILSISVFDFGGTLSGNTLKTGFDFLRVLPPYQDMGIWGQFFVLLGLGMFTIAGYLILSGLHSLQSDYRNMLGNEMNEQDIRYAISENLSMLLLSLVAGGVVVAVIGILLYFIQLEFMDDMMQYPWAVLLLGIPAMLIIAVLIYVLTSKRKTHQ